MSFNPRQSVEIFHLLFLSQLGRKIDKTLYALKGGCNMRFYFNSIRYSEDMDIDITTVAKETLRKNINQILTAQPFSQILKTKNIEILRWSEPKQTDTTQRWKILLRSSASTMPLPTKIEFSRRNFNKEVKFELIDKEILSQYSLTPIMSNHYSKTSMFEQKILALAFRKETQSRDIFDLFLLITSGVTISVQDKQTLECITSAIDNALSVSFTDFVGQVLAYLTEEDKCQYNDEHVWINIVQTVIKSLHELKHEIN